MLKNGQTYFNYTTKFLKHVWPFFNIIHEKVKGTLMQIWKSANIFVFIWK